MKLTQFPFEPFRVNPGTITVIETASTVFFTRIVEALRENNDSVKVSDDENTSKSFTSAIRWLGDPGINLDVNHLFLRVLSGHLLGEIRDEQMVEMVDQSRQLAMNVFEKSFFTDVPFTVSPVTTPETILKFADLHISDEAVSMPCDKISVSIKVLNELEDTKINVLINTSHYASHTNFSDLVEQVAGTDVMMLLIEFSDLSRRQYFKKSRYYFIDQDLVEFGNGQN